MQKTLENICLNIFLLKCLFKNLKKRNQGYPKRIHKKDIATLEKENLIKKYQKAANLLDEEVPGEKIS